MTQFYTILSKDIDESCVCGTLDQALCQVGEDTTGAILTELDHEGKYHTTVASVAIANKWLDRFGKEVNYDWQWEADVYPFIREFARTEYMMKYPTSYYFETDDEPSEQRRLVFWFDN